MDNTYDEVAELMELPPGWPEAPAPGDSHGRSTAPEVIISEADVTSPQDDVSGSLRQVLTGKPERVRAAARLRLPGREQNPHAAIVRDWVRSDAGYVVSGRAGKGGMTGHRGLLFVGEHADHALVVSAIAGRLGCTADEFRSVYARNGGGPLPRDLHPLRDRLNGVLAAIQDEGGSLPLLAQWMGVNPRALQRALERHRGN
jgi:hypothetical protein